MGSMMLGTQMMTYDGYQMYRGHASLHTAMEFVFVKQAMKTLPSHQQQYAASSTPAQTYIVAFTWQQSKPASHPRLGLQLINVRSLIILVVIYKM